MTNSISMGHICNLLQYNVILDFFYDYHQSNKTPLDLILEKKKDVDDMYLYINYTSINTDNPFCVKNKKLRYQLDDYLIENGFEKKLKTSWNEYMNDMKKYRFCLDPPGRGIATYRTFESIIVGTIPIVFDSILIRELFHDLPVIIISNFSQINRTFLDEEYERIISRIDYNFDKLKLDYWINYIRSVS